MYLLGLTFSPPPMTIYTYEQRSTCFSKWLFPPNRSHHLMSISGWRICLIPAAAEYGCRYPPVGRRLPCIGTRSPSVHVRPEPGPVPLPLLTLSPAGLLHPHSCGIAAGAAGRRDPELHPHPSQGLSSPLPVPRAGQAPVRTFPMDSVRRKPHTHRRSSIIGGGPRADRAQSPVTDDGR